MQKYIKEKKKLRPTLLLLFVSHVILNPTPYHISRPNLIASLFYTHSDKPKEKVTIK